MSLRNVFCTSDLIHHFTALSREYGSRSGNRGGVFLGTTPVLRVVTQYSDDMVPRDGPQRRTGTQ